MDKPIQTDRYVRLKVKNGEVEIKLSKIGKGCYGWPYWLYIGTPTIATGFGGLPKDYLRREFHREKGKHMDKGAVVIEEYPTLPESKFRG